MSHAEPDSQPLRLRPPDSVEPASQSEPICQVEYVEAWSGSSRNLAETSGNTRKPLMPEGPTEPLSAPDVAMQTGPRRSETEPDMLTATYPRPTYDAAEYLSTSDTADRLGVSTRTVRQWARDLGFPLIKVGRTVRHDWRDVQDWMAAHRGKSPGQEAARDGGNRRRRASRSERGT